MQPLSRTCFAVGLVALAAFTLVAWSLPSGVAQAARKGKGSQSSAKDFQYELSDCLEADRRDSVGMIVSEDAVRFDHVFTMNCIAATQPNTVKVLYSKKGRDLEVSIVLNSTVLSDCTCPIGIQGKISNLKKGSYRLSFAYESKSDRDEKPTRQALGGKDFTIN
jgi:hypothetical protein